MLIGEGNAEDVFFILEMNGIVVMQIATELTSLFLEVPVWSRRAMSGRYIIWPLAGWLEPLGVRRGSLAGIVPPMDGV